MTVLAPPPVTTPAVPVVDAGLADQAAAALAGTGAVVIRGLVPLALIESLASEVLRQVGQPGANATAYDLAFIERSDALLSLLACGTYLRMVRALVGAQDLVVNRSAAIVRTAGSPQVRWHSDFDGGAAQPTTVDGVLNRGEWPSGLWLYLTGCRPDHGGLWVIPGSQAADWQPAAPFRLTPDRRLILGADGEPAPLDMPGAVAVQAEPGDLVAFAARTFHAASPLEAGTRLSCGVSMRPRQAAVHAPWPLAPATRAWLERLPAAVRPMLEGYVGLDAAWMREQRAG